MGVAIRLAVGLAALSLCANAFAGNPGPMMRGDDGTTHSSVSADSATLVVHGGRWSLDGGAFKTHQTLRLVRGSTLAVIGGRVVELSGANVAMRHSDGSTFVAFAKAGAYRFRDGALTLSVVVSRT